MSLAAGTRVGPYEVVSLLGVGGMGEVYRARDTRLGREVALKVLPDQFVNDPDRLARFAREAQLLAVLNHPNIAQVYGFDEGALSLELVEGPTLADRIAAGPIAVDEALAIARQIADALEAAHAQGIVHRDLKPANIKVREDGTVKVLDFGLAKLADAGGPPSGVLQSLSPTITSPAMATGIGVILGTAAYMAPEQARGKAVDRRADIWAFGCVLFEMLTGRRAFDDEDVSLTLSRILQRDPEFAGLPPSVPHHVRQALELCLRKDPRRRIADVQDVKLLLQNDLGTGAGVVQDAPPRRHSGRFALAAGIVGLVAAAGVGWWFRPSPPAPRDVVRFAVGPPPEGQFPGANGAPRMAISPNGQYLAVTVSHSGKPDQLWIRRFDTLDLVQATNLTGDAVAGTEPIQQPFWSPDSRVVAFFVADSLRKVDINGGVVQTICKVPGNQYGGTWAADGTILFGTAVTKGLMRVAAGGGVPVQVTQIGKGEVAHLWPRFLPDGQHFLYLSVGNGNDSSAVYVGSLSGGTAKRLFASASMADFAPPNLLLYVLDQALLVQRFDVKTAALEGDPIATGATVQATASGRLAVSVSANGALAYSASTESTVDTQLGWIDRSGKDGAFAGPPGMYRGVEITPDGQLAIVHSEEGLGGDLWVFDIARGSRTRLTFDRGEHDSSPVLLPDHRRVLYLKAQSRAIYEKDVTGVGTERLVFKSPGPLIVPWSVTPDGNSVIVSIGDSPNDFDLASLPLRGGGAPMALGARPGAQTHAQISPNGRWLAYTSTQSGAPEIFIESFPVGGTRYQVSTGGGRSERWRADSRELFFRSGNGGSVRFSSVSIEPQGQGLRLGVPQPLFERGLPDAGHGVPMFGWAVSGDGTRFLVTQRPDSQGTGASGNTITIVMNWDKLLAK